MVFLLAINPLHLLQHHEFIGDRNSSPLFGGAT
jgi:hypothetical protein